MIENLIALKQKSFELLQNYKKINDCPRSDEKSKTFSSFEEFVSFIAAQQEVFNLELWKLEAINNYLDQIKVTEPKLNQSIHDSFNL